MKDFTLEEMKWMEEAANKMDDAGPDGLKDRITQAREEREELESMDLDDCLGGACKL